MFTVLLIILGSQSVHRSTEATSRRRHLANNQIERDCLTFPEPIKEVLAQTGATAELPCKLDKPRVGRVTWIQHRDGELLTVSSQYGYKYDSLEPRIMVRPSLHDRSLIIRMIRKEDAGLYECQIHTVPVQRQFICLNVAEAYSVIPGAPDLYVKQGSSLRLECHIMATKEIPAYLFWYLNGHMINYDYDYESESIVEGTEIVFTLLFNKTEPYHAGNYTCVPSNARNASVMIHLIEEEEKPAISDCYGGVESSTIKFSSNLGLTLIMLLVVHTVQNLGIHGIYARPWASLPPLRALPLESLV